MNWIDRFVALWHKAAPAGKVDLERRLFLRGFAVTSAGLVVPSPVSVVIPGLPENYLYASRFYRVAPWNVDNSHWYYEPPRNGGTQSIYAIFALAI